MPVVSSCPVRYDEALGAVVIETGNGQTLTFPPERVRFEPEPGLGGHASDGMKHVAEMAMYNLTQFHQIPDAHIAGVHIEDAQPMYQLGDPEPALVPGPSTTAVITMSNIVQPPSQTTDATWTWKEPQIRCPNCESIVNGLESAQEVVQIGSPTTTAAGKPKPKFNQDPVNTPTSNQVGAVRMVWRVATCGCQVSPEWAGAYKAEVNRRANGETPKKVVEMTEAQREQQKKELEKWITFLYGEKAKIDKAPGIYSAQQVLGVEKSLVMAVDRLMKLCPGAHNKLPSTELNQATLQWAAHNQLAIPPKEDKDKIPDVSEILEMLVKSNVTTPAAEAEAAANAMEYASQGYQSQPVNPSSLVKAAAHMQSIGNAVSHSLQHMNPNIVLQTKPDEGPVCPQAPISFAAKPKTQVNIPDGYEIELPRSGVPEQELTVGGTVRDAGGNIIGVVTKAPTTDVGGTFQMIVQNGEQKPGDPQVYVYKKDELAWTVSASPEMLLKMSMTMADEIWPMVVNDKAKALAELKEANAVLHAMVKVKLDEKTTGGFPGISPTGISMGTGMPSGPVVPPLMSQAQAVAAEQAKKALAKQIQAELVANQATGSPLSTAAKAFLLEHQKQHGGESPTPEPMSGGVPITGPDREEIQKEFLDKLGRKRVRRISKMKKPDE